MIAVSEWTKRDVVNLLKVEPELVDVIPHGVHPRFRRLPDEDIAAFKRAKAIPDGASSSWAAWSRARTWSR